MKLKSFLKLEYPFLAKVKKGYSNFKKLLSLMMVWGLIFSLVTIWQLRVGFDYDDTLVFSTPALNQAYASGAIPFSPEFCKVVNLSYDLYYPKLLEYAFACTFR